MKVYVLWHIHTLVDDFGEHDEEKLIGIYSTKENAEKAIGEHMTLPGFNELPVDCFEIHETTVDRSDWTDGFVTTKY